MQYLLLLPCLMLLPWGQAAVIQPKGNMVSYTADMEFGTNFTRTRLLNNCFTQKRVYYDKPTFATKLRKFYIYIINNHPMQ